MYIYSICLYAYVYVYTQQINEQNPVHNTYQDPQQNRTDIKQNYYRLFSDPYVSAKG